MSKKIEIPKRQYISLVWNILEKYFSLNPSEIRNPINDYYDFEEDNDPPSHSLRELEPYNEGMNLFVSAIQIKDPELKFLNFYFR